MPTGSEGGSGILVDDYESLLATSDIVLLKTAWRNEKADPEILKFQLLWCRDPENRFNSWNANTWWESVIHSVRGDWNHDFLFNREDVQQIPIWEDTVEEFKRSGFDPLIVSIYQMDLERAQFLLRSYLRIRLLKIVNDMIHISKTDLWNHLSREEQNFASRCSEHMKNYMDEAVLSKLPSGYQSNVKQSIASEEDDMVPEPHLDTFVFCKSKGSLGAIPLDDSADEIVDLIADDLYVLRYKSIKPYVESGQVDLV